LPSSRIDLDANLVDIVSETCGCNGWLIMKWRQISVESAPLIQILSDEAFGLQEQSFDDDSISFARTTTNVGFRLESDY
jgi:hypothetical protein